MEIVFSNLTCFFKNERRWNPVKKKGNDKISDLPTFVCIRNIDQRIELN